MRTRRWVAAGTVAAAFAAAPALVAQTAATGITGIAHIAFRVSDVDKEIGFLNKLGFLEAFSNTSGGKTTEVFMKVNDHEFIELYPQSDPPQPLGWMHACYESDDLQALNALLVARGLKPTPVRKAAAGNVIFSLSDPEGRVVEFTQYMPGSRHTLDRGQHLGEDRISDTLLGFELPVKELAIERDFYTQLGFDAEDGEASVHLTAPGAPGLRLVLNASGPHGEPQMLFTVPDARKAAEHLRRLGLQVDRENKLDFVRDPDGNVFVLLETGF